MSRFRLALVASAALAILAMSGVAASSASAAFVLTELKCEGGTFKIICDEVAGALFEVEGEEEFEILSPSNVTLAATLGESTVNITCTSTTATENLVLQAKPLEANASIDAVLTFKGCVLNGTLGEKCKVPVERSTEKLVGTPNSAEDIVFKPATGTTFITIPFEEKSKCPATIKGEKKVTGSQLCTFANPGVDEAEHLLTCGVSELLLAENAATFTFDSNIFLKNLGTNWDIVEVG